MLKSTHLIAAAALGAAIFAAPPSFAQDKSIVVASTTSTRDSGLFDYLLPKFKAKTGITVKVVAQGTGKALDTGRRCDADVLFVHAKAAEEKFIKEGYGGKRHPVMYNDFVVVGPKSDPAATKAIEDILRKISARGVKVVMSTHDLGQARRVAGDIVLLHRGRLVENAPAVEFFANPRTDAGRKFIAGELLV